MMKKQTTYGLALILATPLCAQGWLYSPRHLNTKNEGVRQSYYFGAFANGRNQIADGENRQAALITAFNVRRDFQMNYNEYSGMGRKWTNVKVTIGEGSIEKFSATFSANFMTTPCSMEPGASPL